MGDAAPTPTLQDALAVVDSVHDDPTTAMSNAQAIVDRVGSPPEVAVVGYWALGLAARQMNDLTDAESALSTGIKLALENGLIGRAGQVRSSLSLVHLYQGDSERALQEAERASDSLSGGELARNQMQTALILQRLGRLDESLVRYRAALVGLRKARDRLAEARLLANRGVLHAYRGELDQGAADLASASELAESLGQGLIVAGCIHNRGFLEARRGDVPAALALYGEAEQAYETLGRPPGMVEVLDANRAELLLSVGLFEEAAEAAAAALDGLEASDNATDLSETRLLSAEVALAAGRFDDALEHAKKAATEFDQQEREAWRLLADYASVRAELETETGSLSSVASVAELASALRSAGLRAEGQHCELLAGRIALREGDIATARTHLTRAAGARVGGPAVDRVQAWLALALLRRAELNPTGTARAIRAGMRVMRDYRATLGTTELRSYSAAHGLELATLATQQALDTRSVWRVLQSVEDWRSISEQVRSVRPPPGEELTTLLAELRGVNAQLRDAALASRSTEKFASQKTRLESRVRAVGRRERGPGTHGTSDPWTRDRVVSSLRGRHLLSFFTFGGQIHVVSVRDGTASMKQLMSADEAHSELSSLLFSLTRLAIGGGSSASLETAAESMDYGISRLRARLLDGIELGEGPVTVVPTGVLHGLPWPALIPGAEVSVTPSLESWASAASKPPKVDNKTVAALVAGPGLQAAPYEVAQLARIYPHRRRLTGRNAKAATVIDRIDGAGIAHVAAHGRFRADNPSFSSLEMFDGPLTVYDLEHIRVPPRVMVLSSCDTGASKVVAGDELLGLAAALIGMGVSNLIAPLVPISDEMTPSLMVQLHRRLRGGVRPPEALADLIGSSHQLSHQERALRYSFICLGA